MNFWNIQKKYKWAYLGLAASTLMFVVMMPHASGGEEWGLTPWTCIFSWFFLVPLWHSTHREKRSVFLIFGFLFCFLSTLWSLSWIFIAMKKYGDLSSLYSMFVLILTAFSIGAIRWLAFIISCRWRNDRYSILILASIFTFVEWFMFWIPIGFPWITPAHAVYPMITIIQSIDLFGVYGMNFFVFVINFLWIDILNKRSQHLSARKSAITIAVIFIFLFSYGYIEKKRYSDVSSSQSLKVALLQGDIPQDLKWEPKERQEIIQNYLSLTAQAQEENPDLIVWPEASLPKTISREATDISVLPWDVQKVKSLLLGAASWEQPAHQKISFYNTAFVLDGDGNIQSRYDKIRLVPFGEYVPSFGIIPIQKIVPAVAGNFHSGSIDQPIPQAAGHSFGLFICFEVLFPELARNWVDKGADFFVTISNDAWFDLSSGPYQHLRFAALRAIEFRKPIVRAANTGISTWFDATGQQHDTLGLLKRGIIMATIYPNHDRTFYDRYPYLLAFLLCISCGYAMIRRRIS